MSMHTLQSLVEQLPTFGDRPAVGLRREFGVRWWSYRRLHREARRIALWLGAQGVQPGDRLLLWLPNCPEWVGFLLGAALRGAVVVPVDDGAAATYVQDLAAETGAVLLVHDPSYDVSGLALPAHSCHLPDCWPAPPDGTRLAAPLDPDAPAVIIYTSGTTQRPKGVVLTHRNLVAQLGHFQRWARWTRRVPTRLLVTAPLSHVQGLMLGGCVPFAIGLSVLYTSSVDPAHLIRSIRANRVNVLSTVPRVQHLLAKTLRHTPGGPRGHTLEERARRIRPRLLRRMFLRQLSNRSMGRQFRVLLVGGATLPPEDEQFWREARFVIVQGYGLTETAAIVSVNTPLLGGAGSIGRPFGDQEVRIAPDGELLVRGSNITPGYTRNGSTDTTAFDSDGFLHTGDLVRRDDKNRLYFLGRKKDVIVIGEGHNIYPHEVEEALNQLPGVMDSVVCGLARDGHEEVHASLLLRPGTDAAAVIQQANGQLAAHQMIRSWSSWPEPDFPRTALLKVKRAEVVARIQAQDEPAPPAAEAAELPTIEQIIAEPNRSRRLQLLAQALTELPPDRLEQGRMLAELGLSSLDVVELLTLIEQRRRVPLDRVIVPQDATLSDIQTLLEQPARAPAERGQSLTSSPWVNSPPLRLARALVAPAFITRWVGRRARLRVYGQELLAGLRHPFIIAGAHHRHGSDAMLIYAALPPRLRPRMLVVSGDWVFREYFDPPPGTSLPQRLMVGAGFFFGLPMLFPFTVLPAAGMTRMGLLEVCRWIDLGFSPLIFPEIIPAPEDRPPEVQQGIGLVASDTQVPILPVRLSGNDFISFRPGGPQMEITVRFGRPISPVPGRPAADVVTELREVFQELA